MKGFYFSEKNLVNEVLGKVTDGNFTKDKFRTLECSIMDVSDDIAYSTNDIEDSLKAGFISPISMVSTYGDLLESIHTTVQRRLEDYCKETSQTIQTFDQGDIIKILIQVFNQVLSGDLNDLTIRKNINSEQKLNTLTLIISDAFNTSNRLSSNGYLRTALTSQLVGIFIRGVRFK